MGIFQLADTGTLFLDEVAELPLLLQAKLLRVSENRKFRKVGGSRRVQVDVRLIAAINRNLAELVKQGRFREGVFSRLNIFSLTSPPLREGKEDVPLRVNHFLEHFN